MAIRTTKDGRIIRTHQHYTQFRLELWDAQKGRCIECGQLTWPDLPIDYENSFHVAHRGSRGMGAGFRDDVVGPKRGQVEGGKCGTCHRREHGQSL